jgi:hypothetical protein
MLWRGSRHSWLSHEDFDRKEEQRPGRLLHKGIRMHTCVSRLQQGLALSPCRERIRFNFFWTLLHAFVVTMRAYASSSCGFMCGELLEQEVLTYMLRS